MVSSPDNILYAGTYGAGVYRSTDDGATWSSLNNGLSSLNISDITVDSTGNVYAAINRKGVFKYSTNDNSWILVNNGIINWSVVSIHTNSKGYIFAGTILSTGDDNGNNGGGGEIYRSSDAGLTWELKTYLGGNIIEDVSISSNSRGEIFVASSGGLIKSTDDGESWVQIYGTNVDNVFINSDHHIFIGLDMPSGGGLLRSTDDGNTWTNLLPNLVYKVTENSNNELFAGTSNNGVLISLNNGETWESINNGVIPTYINHVQVHEDYVFASASNCLYSTRNRGLTWEERNSGIISSRVNMLEVDTEGNIFAVAGDYFSPEDEIFRSTNQGSSWENISNNLPSTLINSIEIANDGSIMIAAHDLTIGQLFHSTDNGDHWTELLNGFTIFHPVGIVRNNANEMFVATDGDGVLKSSDNGQTWTNVSFGLGCSNLSSIIIDLEGNLLVGTTCYETGIYKSSDNGATWNPSGTLFNESSIRFLKMNTDGVLFAANNYIHRSLNNGLTWENINSNDSFGTMFDLEVGPDSKVIVSTFDGIFESNNNGDTWSEINDGLIATDSRSVTVAPDGTIYASIWGNGVWKNNLITDVPELADSKKFSIYPNPAISEITISYPTFGNPTANLYNANGTLVKTIQLNNASTRVSLDNLSKGMYFITLSGYDKGQKLIIQ